MSDSSSENAPSDPKHQYLIDQIMPTDAIHLIGGPSGSGKSTLTFQIIEDWQKKKPIWGYDTFPLPFIYIPCDRSHRSTQQTLDRIRPKVEIPILSLVDHPVSHHMPNVLAAARKQVPDVRVLFIDAIGLLLPPETKISDYQGVGAWLAGVNRFCAKEHITVIGLGHSAKTKEGEGYKNPRERILGSVAWGGMAECVIFIEPNKVDDPSDTSRTVFVLSHNTEEFSIPYHFDSSGRLVDGELETTHMLLESAVRKLPQGQPYPTAHFVDLGFNLGLSRASVFRWLAVAEEKGILERVKKGIWRRPYKT